MPVRLLRRSGQIKVDPSASLRKVGEAIVERIRAQARAGMSANGSALPSYSPLYAAQLAVIGGERAGELSRSGALLAGIRVLRIERVGDRWSVVVGPGSGTSPRVPRPPPWAMTMSRGAAAQARALARWKASPKKPSTSPSHSLLLRFLGRGAHGRRGRNILGLPRPARTDIARMMEKLPVFKP